MKDKFLRLERFTSGFAMLVACAMMFIAASLGLFQIITRFVLETPAEWTEVMIRFSLRCDKDHGFGANITWL